MPHSVATAFATSVLPVPADSSSSSIIVAVNNKQEFSTSKQLYNNTVYDYRI